jgi:hypothetical protein
MVLDGAGVVDGVTTVLVGIIDGITAQDTMIK